MYPIDRENTEQARQRAHLFPHQPDFVPSRYIAHQRDRISALTTVRPPSLSLSSRLLTTVLAGRDQTLTIKAFKSSSSSGSVEPPIPRTDRTDDGDTWNATHQAMLAFERAVSTMAIYLPVLSTPPEAARFRSHTSV